MGTDDGNVWRTDNGGMDWISLSDGLHDRWVTKVQAGDLPNEVYVTFSGYRYGVDEGMFL